MSQDKCKTCPTSRACANSDIGDSLQDRRVREIVATQMSWSGIDTPENWRPCCFLTEKGILERIEELKKEGKFSCFIPAAAELVN